MKVIVLYQSIACTLKLATFFMLQCQYYCYIIVVASIDHITVVWNNFVFHVFNLSVWGMT